MKLLKTKPTLKVSFHSLPKTYLELFSEKDVEDFNKIYQHCYDNYYKLPEYRYDKKRDLLPCYYLKTENLGFNLILCNENAEWSYIRLRFKRPKEGDMSGREAFKIYKKELQKDGVDIEEYSIDNGLDYKAQIPMPKIGYCLRNYDKVIENAHHIDLNSAYNAGLIESFPEFKPTVLRLYSQRKENPVYKDILNMTTGYFQSQYIDYRFSQLALAAHLYTHRRLEEMSEYILSQKRIVIAYNTDGIWYSGDQLLIPDSGKEIGQWKHDAVNCKIRFKSPGAYEYIDSDGNYKPVVRGVTTLDREKPRSEWVWGDIYKGSLINFSFLEGFGVIQNVND